jgi:2',3'-cyclic-nucleotide 2'-phosphodiesterase (5'-nucleotidase family)
MTRVRAVFCALIAACAPQKSTEAPRSSERAPPVVITVVGTNDVHGRLERLPILAGYVDVLRRQRSRDGGLLLVDAGDAFQGTLESHLDEGATLIAAYNRMGYAAMALGNHEFDFGPVGPESLPGPDQDPFGALKARLTEARFPVLSANLVTPVGELPRFPNLHASTLTEIAGIPIGIVGAMTRDAERVIKRPNFEGLATSALADAVREQAVLLRERGAIAVIVVAHAGAHCDSIENPRDLTGCDAGSEAFRLARDLAPGLVDVIVAGHRSKPVAHWVAGVPVVQAQTGLKAFSRVDLLVDREAKRVVDRRLFPPQLLCTEESEAARSCQPQAYEGATVRSDPAIETIIAPILTQAARIRSEPLGVRSTHAFGAHKRSECPLGNLFVDIMREAVEDSDVALANGGSLRSPLPVGDLTQGDLYDVMPFDNQLAVLTLSGAELRRLVVANVTGDQGLMSVSGLRVEVECRGSEVVAHLRRPDGRDVADDETLVVVTSDFIALGGDGLLAAADVRAPAPHFDSSRGVRDILARGLRQRSTVDPGALALFDEREPRIRLPGPIPLRCAD